MADRIRVVIVDDIAETRDHLARLLSFEPDIEISGSVASGAEAIALTSEKEVDVVLLDINMPGLDGIETAEQLAVRAPTASIIMMSVQGEPDYLRRAMLAGAREFLVKPFSSDELAASIRQVHQRERQKIDRASVARPQSTEANNEAPRRRSGKVITFFSPKGGVGRTTLAVNYAVAASSELNLKVALIDGGLQFGDVGVLLNLNPKNQTIADVAREMATGDMGTLETTLVDHSSGVRVLMAPPSPEMAELVTPDHLTRIIGALRATHDLVVIDCSPLLQDVTLSFLDQSDVIFAVLTLEITNIKNIRQFLALVDQLGYPEDKVQLLLNRSDSGYGIRLQDVESSIGRKINAQRRVGRPNSRLCPQSRRAIRRGLASDAGQRGHRANGRGDCRRASPCPPRPPCRGCRAKASSSGVPTDAREELRCHCCAASKALVPPLSWDHCPPPVPAAQGGSQPPPTTPASTAHDGGRGRSPGTSVPAVVPASPPASATTVGPPGACSPRYRCASRSVTPSSASSNASSRISTPSSTWPIRSR